jgi:G3E family GTPase
MNADARTPVTVLTGFLGSGKTTVLNRLLQRPELADTAVVINELGEIGIDHLLVDHIGENMRLLQSGCLCCTVRGDLVDTLAGLATKRARGEVRFQRVVVETTGLADPVPVLHTVMADPALTGNFRLDGVVTTVDAVSGLATLARHAEAVKQVGVADALLLTKTDLADAASMDPLAARLERLNPGARVHHVIDGVVDPAQVIGSGWIDPADRCAPSACCDDPDHDHHDHHDGHHSPHDERIRTHAFTFEAPLPEAGFLHWLELMAAMRGEQLLRVKGLVCLAEDPGCPLVVHGAQHVFHPPRRLAAWPSQDRRTRLVFIVDGIARADIERTFRKFVQVSEEPTA